MNIKYYNNGTYKMMQLITIYINKIQDDTYKYRSGILEYSNVQ